MNSQPPKKSPRVFVASFAFVLSGVIAGCFELHASSNPPPAKLEFRVTGQVEHLAPIDSQFVDKRSVDVWLPPSYFEAGAKSRRYPVLYVHDGQNAFDPATSFIGVDWAID